MITAQDYKRLFGEPIAYSANGGSSVFEICKDALKCLVVGTNVTNKIKFDYDIEIQSYVLHGELIKTKHKNVDTEEKLLEIIEGHKILLAAREKPTKEQILEKRKKWLDRLKSKNEQK